MERRTRGDGGLYKRADGMWIGVVEIPTEDGLRKRKTVSSKDRLKALTKLRDLRREVEAGKLPTSSNTTVEKWMTHWLETIQTPRVRPNTMQSYYEPVVRVHIIPALGHKRIDKLTPAEVRAVLKRISSEPNRAASRLLALKRELAPEEREKSRGTSTRTAQKVHQVLDIALADAVSEGILARNIMDVIDKPDHIPDDREPFTWDEARQVIATALELNDPWTTMWVALFFTTARQGEAIGMELSRCDLDKGVFDFEWQIQYRPKEIKPGFEYRDLTDSLIFTLPKSDAGRRYVPMTAPFWKIMANYVGSKTGPNPHGLMWTHADGRPIAPRDADKAWRKLIEQSGVPYRSMHATRHTSITELNNAGVTQETRMKVAGHATPAAHRKYVGEDIEAGRKALSNLDGLLG